jgi:double-stranded uracil-DNA glycosylase
MDRANRVGYAVVETLPDVLDDLLSQSLQVVFCGTAVGTASAKAAAYYANRQNKFWKILYETRLTPELLQPRQYRDLLNHRIGLTDFVKTHFGMDHQIPLSQLGEIARTRLRSSILECRPKFLAFTSKTAGQKFLGGKRDYGEQIELIGDTRIWILPSTSGAANGAWRPEIWHQFADRVRSALPG